RSRHGRRDDVAVRPPRDGRAHRGPLGLRAERRRLLRADRVEQAPHPRGTPLLHLRAPVGAAVPRREAARARRVRLAGEGLARRVPRSRRARDHAHRAGRTPDSAHRRPHVTDRPRELGLGLQSDKRPGEYATLARAADDAGFDVVTVFNDLWFQPSLPALLEIAAATRRARIGPSCLNPFTVHPVEIAGQVAALDRASRGRAFPGRAAGSWLEPLSVEQTRPVTAIAEAWEIVRRLLRGDTTGFAGTRFTLPAGARLRYEVERAEV